MLMLVLMPAIGLLSLWAINWEPIGKEIEREPSGADFFPSPRVVA
jgi:hypothetical protein